MDVTDVTGRFGPWQRRIFYALLYRGIPLACVWFSGQFYKSDMEYWCAPDDGRNQSRDEWRSCCVPAESKCEKYLFDEDGFNTNESTKCDSWEFQHHSPDIMQEWSLVCHRSWLLSFSLTMMLLGNALTYAPAGVISDRFGRRKTCLTGMCSLVVFGVISYFSPSVEFYLAMRFFLGVSYGLFQSIAICLFVEWVGPEYRLLMSISFLGASGVGMMLCAGLGYFISDWRTLHLVTYVPISLITPLLFYKFVPEPPRWLITVGRYKEAEELICKAAKMNNKEIVDISLVMKKLKEKIIQEEEEEKSKVKVTIVDLFRTRALRKMTFVLWSSLFLNIFIGSGFVFGAEHLGGSIYMNYFILGLTETLSTPVFILQAKYMPRKRALLANLIFASACFICTLATPEDLQSLRITFSMLGRTSIALAYTLWWLLSAEIFPTNLRGIGINGGMTVGRIGGALSTFMGEVGRVGGKNTPMIVFATLSVLSSLLFLLLPETRDKHLPDTIKESERLPETAESAEPK